MMTNQYKNHDFKNYSIEQLFYVKFEVKIIKLSTILN